MNGHCRVSSYASGCCSSMGIFQLSTHMYACTPAQTHACMHTHTHTHTHTHASTHAHTHIHKLHLWTRLLKFAAQTSSAWTSSLIDIEMYQIKYCESFFRWTDDEIVCDVCLCISYTHQKCYSGGGGTVSLTVINFFKNYAHCFCQSDREPIFSIPSKGDRQVPHLVNAASKVDLNLVQSFFFFSSTPPPPPFFFHFFFSLHWMQQVHWCLTHTHTHTHTRRNIQQQQQKILITLRIKAFSCSVSLLLWHLVLNDPSPSPWYNHTGWLGIKHQLTYLPTLAIHTHNYARTT